MAHRLFILFDAIRRLVTARFTTVQSALVAGLELFTADRAVLLVDLASDVLVLVAAGDATVHAA